MDNTVIGLMVTLCLVLAEISDAVQVTDAVCNSTYTLNKHDNVVLTFTPDAPFDDGHTFKYCVFTIINNSTSMPICIKNEGMGHTSFFYRDLCSRAFQYFIGRRPSTRSIRMKNGQSCSSFEGKPKCTSRSRVYVVFKNVHYYTIYPVSVELYVKDWVVSTTTIRPTTTAYWYNNDLDYEEYTGPDVGNIMIKAVVGIAIVVTLFCICSACVRVKYNDSGNTGTQEERYYQQTRTYTTDTPSPRPSRYTTDTHPQTMSRRPIGSHLPRSSTYTPDNHPPRTPRYTSDSHSPRRSRHRTDGPNYSPRVSSYNEDAPSYSEVMQNQRTYSYELNVTLQIQDPENGQATTANVADEIQDEDQPLNPDQPVTRYTFEEQDAGNQNIPTTPPPDYADLPPPPPYPGY